MVGRDEFATPVLAPTPSPKFRPLFLRFAVSEFFHAYTHTFLRLTIVATVLTKQANIHRGNTHPWR